MPVDNELYNYLGDTWWDENGTFSTLRTWLGPVRFGYFRRILLEKYRRDAQGIKVLDVGAEVVCWLNSLPSWDAR